MLLQLDIENVAVFEKASVTFESGLNVITGETGAGKSLLINSLNLVLGCRGAHGLIRSGADFAAVNASFFDKNVDSVLTENGIECDDGNIIISRRLYRDGRNQCRINGASVPVSLLREIGKKLVAIHGQRDNAVLLSAPGQLSFVDSFSGSGELLNQYREAYKNYKSAERSLAQMQSDESERAREIDFLSFQVDEITRAELTDGEEDELLKRRKVLDNAETLSELSREMQQLICGDRGVRDSLYSALRSGERLSEIDDSLKSCTERLTDIYYELEELGRDISAYSSSVDFNPRELDEIEDRLAVINSLKRKYGGSLEAVIAYGEKSQARLAELMSYDDNLSALEKEAAEQKKEAERLGAELAAVRTKGAEKLAAAINAELATLDMSEARITFAFTHCGLSEHGTQYVEMLFSSNPKSAPAPIEKIASGGELSRIMLALKSVFSDFDKTPTLLFDEIDTGVSGRAAEKIAAKMRRLAGAYQLICVTHLPIIAAAGTNHLLIEKCVDSSGAVTSVYPLAPEKRAAELARMISGDKITDVSLENARQMLAAYA